MPGFLLCHRQLSRPEKHRKKDAGVQVVTLGQLRDDEYYKLVEDIKYIVSMSPCITQLEERCVPLDSLIHGFLEQVCNHERYLSESLQHDTEDTESDRAHKQVGGASCSNKGKHRVQKQARGRKRKDAGIRRQRSNEQSEDAEEDGFEDNENHSEGELETSEQSLCAIEPHEQYSCPFRKRNPTRFNIRDHHRCALRGFADLALLK